MENETGLDREFITQTLSKFENDKKVIYRDGIVWVVNMNRYHKNGSPRTMTKVMNELSYIPDSEIKMGYMCCNFPDIYGIDTVSILDTVILSVIERVKVSVTQPAPIPLPESPTPETTSAEKIRAVCNASPAWAIGHGEVPTQITDEQREKDSINQFPQIYQAYAEAYILETKRLATKNEIGRWGQAFKEMAARGVTPEILTATIREMRNKGLTNTWPGSCTNMAAAKAAGRKRVEVETPAPIEDIFARPAFIPENRWRKATQ